MVNVVLSVASSFVCKKNCFWIHFCWILFLLLFFFFANKKVRKVVSIVCLNFHIQLECKKNAKQKQFFVFCRRKTRKNRNGAPSIYYSTADRELPKKEVNFFRVFFRFFFRFLLFRFSDLMLAKTGYSI